MRPGAGLEGTVGAEAGLGLAAVVLGLTCPVDVVLVGEDADEVGLVVDALLEEPEHFLVGRVALGAGVDDVDLAAFLAPPAFEVIDEELVAVDRVAQDEGVAEHEDAEGARILRRGGHRIVAQAELVDVELDAELGGAAGDALPRGLAPAELVVELVQDRLGPEVGEEAQTAFEQDEGDEEARGEGQEDVERTHGVGLG